VGSSQASLLSAYMGHGGSSQPLPLFHNELPFLLFLSSTPEDTTSSPWLMKSREWACPGSGASAQVIPSTCHSQSPRLSFFAQKLKRQWVINELCKIDLFDYISLICHFVFLIKVLSSLPWKHNIRYEVKLCILKPLILPRPLLGNLYISNPECFNKNWKISKNTMWWWILRETSYLV
jgi:hypothetical protein